MRRCQVCNRKMPDGSDSSTLTCPSCSDSREKEAWRKSVEAVARRSVAEVFPLGVFVAEELQARGWSVEDLCRGTAMPEHRVRELLADPNCRISFRESEWLGGALGVSACLLLNLQMAYHKWKGSSGG